MCGLAGIISSLTEKDSVGIVSKMIAAQFHRGPDGNNIINIPLGIGKNLCLGHTRLSILDLRDVASQPFYDPLSESWLVFNGEIYNYLSLRNELSIAGHIFKSNGDTEVLLKALIEWGPQVMSRLRGMYAFAFWDGRRQELFLGRDPFGIKPLLLSNSNNKIVFASEIRAILETGCVHNELNRNAVISYFTFGATLEPGTIINGLVMVPPGHVVIADRNGKLRPPKAIVSIENIISSNHVPKITSFADACSTIEDVLKRSINNHLVSDVPTGILLSGGIDSSLLSVLANQTVSDENLNFLTLSFENEEFDESYYASIIASNIKGKHLVHRISDEEIFKSIPAYIACMDQPSADGFNTFIISKFAAENEIKVLLSGIGADELFAGYTSFWKTNFLTKYSNIINIYIKYFLHKNDLYKSKFFKLNTLNNISEYRDSYILQRSINHQTEKYFNLPFGNSLITPELWDRMMVDDRWSNFHRIVFFESVFYMLNQLLRDADIFSSANSVEIRTPFLDLDLFETSMSIASKNHIIFSNGKRILNSILLKNAPNYIIHKKKGFVVPISGIFEKPKFLKKIKEVIDSKEHYEGTGMKVQDGQNLISNYLKYKNEIYLSKIWSLFILLSWNNLRLEKA